jgi:hypothetical protein
VGGTDQGGTVEIAADSLSLLYTPAAGFTGTEQFTYQISDGNGGSDEANVTVEVSGGVQDVRFHFQTVSVTGEPVDTIRVGDLVVLQVAVEDLREEPGGVFSAYLDVTYDPDPLRVAGNIQFNNDKYPSGQSGSAAVRGELDEVGAVDGLAPIGGGAISLFEIPFAAENPGTVTFVGNPADLPANEVTLFGAPTAVPPELIDYGSFVLTVDPASGFTNALRPLDVNDDGIVSPIDALLVITDISDNGARRLVRSQTKALAAMTTASSTAYVDVNGDGSVTPLDALLVINWLTQSSRAGSSDPRAALSAAVDLSDQGTAVDTGAAGGTVPGVVLCAADRDSSGAGDATILPRKVRGAPYGVIATGQAGFGLVSIEGAAQVTEPYSELSGSRSGHATSVSSDEAEGDLEETLAEIAGEVAAAWHDTLR